MKESLEKAKDIVKRSGNNFHCKVVNYLREANWTVLISPYYNDNILDKPREIDLIAEKPFDVFCGNFGNIKGTINIKLFIECKYVNNEIVFWFDQKDRQKAEEILTTYTPLRPDNSYTQKHHYLTHNQVGKLFDTGSKKQPENDFFFKAINQSLNALIYYRNSTSIIPNSNKVCPNILTSINYPIILFNTFNKVFHLDMAGQKDLSIVEDNFQVEVNYAYLNQSKNSVNEYFLIDIVDFNRFDNFFSIIKADNDAISVLLD